MLRRFVLVVSTIGALILALMSQVPQRIAAEIIIWIIGPSVKPYVEQFIPFAKQQLQSINQQIQTVGKIPFLPNIWSLPQYMIERDIKTIIQYTASGYIDGTHVVILALAVMFTFGLMIFFAIQFESRRRRLSERENPMKIFPKILFGISMGMLAYGSVVLLNEIRLSMGAIQVSKVFARNLTVIAPYISQQQEKELRSKYVLMKTRDDIRAIDAIMLPIMRENGIPVAESKSESQNTETSQRQ